MVKRLPQQGQRVEKKIIDLLLDLTRAEAELKAAGFKPKASKQLQTITAVRKVFDNPTIKDSIIRLKNFGEFTSADKPKVNK